MESSEFERHDNVPHSLSVGSLLSPSNVQQLLASPKTTIIPSPSSPSGQRKSYSPLRKLLLQQNSSQTLQALQEVKKEKITWEKKFTQIDSKVADIDKEIVQTQKMKKRSQEGYLGVNNSINALNERGMEHDRMLAALQSSIFDLKAQIQQNLTETNQKIEHVSRIIEEKFAMLSLKLDSEAESRKEEDKSLKTKAASLQDMIHSLEKIQEFEKIDSENKNAKINQLQFQITQLEATVDKKHSEISTQQKASEKQFTAAVADVNDKLQKNYNFHEEKLDQVKSNFQKKITECNSSIAEKVANWEKQLKILLAPIMEKIQSFEKEKNLEIRKLNESIEALKLTAAAHGEQLSKDLHDKNNNVVETITAMKADISSNAWKANALIEREKEIREEAIENLCRAIEIENAQREDSEKKILELLDHSISTIKESYSQSS